MSSIILHGNLCRSREHMFGFMLKLRTFLWQTSLSRSELTLRTCFQHPIKLDSIFLFSFISRMGGDGLKQIVTEPINSFRIYQ